MLSDRPVGYKDDERSTEALLLRSLLHSSRDLTGSVDPP